MFEPISRTAVLPGHSVSDLLTMIGYYGLARHIRYSRIAFFSSSFLKNFAKKSDFSFDFPLFHDKVASP